MTISGRNQNGVYQPYAELALFTATLKRRKRMDRFDTLLGAAQTTGSSPTWLESLARVADTAFLCRAWLEVYAPAFTPSDLLAMTKMVVDREAIENARLDTLDAVK